MPDVIEPMKARLAEAPSTSENWATEIKWDGVRAIAFVEDGVLRLQGRNLNDITDLGNNFGIILKISNDFKNIERDIEIAVPDKILIGHRNQTQVKFYTAVFDIADIGQDPVG